MKRPRRFRQGDVTRIMKGAKAAGETVKVEVRPDGTIIATPVTSTQALEPDNEWDAVK